ncbi:hypothetical protein EAO75_27825 [Streptomyces sp. uw30]|nr:hypothetical protein EAO75_27825 [Streptomyces sp. uw30]
MRLGLSGSRLLITVGNDGVCRHGRAESRVRRERALSVGGELHAGPRPEGGFEVATVLPPRSRRVAPSRWRRSCSSPQRAGEETTGCAACALWGSACRALAC